jgi:hypothetical protein
LNGRPDLIALLVCETVLIDQRSGLPTLLNVFRDVGINGQLPASIKMACYARLANGEGHHVYRWRVVELGNGAVMHEEEMQSDWPPERNFLDLVKYFFQVQFLRYGFYEFQLFADEDFLGRALVKVKPDEGNISLIIGGV